MSQLTIENFEEKVTNDKGICLLTFTATWCKPSLLQKEVLPNLDKKFPEKVKIWEIDVDVNENENLAQKFDAKTLPTSVLFAKGELVEVLPGYQAEDFLEAYIKHLMAEIEKAEAK